MTHFDEWWNSAEADSFRSKHEDLDGEVFRTVWDAATQQAGAPIVNMTPPATRRDRWMYEQGRLAERDAHTLGSVAADGPVILPEPAVVVGNVFQLFWASSETISVIVKKYGLHIGTKLYTEQQVRALLAGASAP